jgi:hypothetical protein
MAKAKSLYLLFLTLIILILLASCGDSKDSLEPEIAEVPQATGFDYLVALDDSPSIEVSGSPFKVTTDNCGSRVSSIETFTRSRDFSVTLHTEISESIRAEIGGSVGVADAEIGAAIGGRLGLQVGSTESVQSERRVETPADSITTATLQWEEIWQTGRVSINQGEGNSIGDVPFRVLTTVRLSQIGIEDIPCGTLPAGTDEPGEITSSEPEPATEPAVPTNTPEVLRPNDTPTSEDTATSTSTPTETPTPLFSLPFIETFEGPLDEDVWRVVEGDYVIQDGKIGGSGQELALQIGDESLTNYEVQFSFENLICWPNSLSWGNILEYQFYSCNTFWKSEGRTIAEGPDFPSSGEVKVIVNDGRYVVELNGQEVDNIVHTPPYQGPLRIKLWSLTRIDNFEINPLNQ